MELKSVTVVFLALLTTTCVSQHGEHEDEDHKKCGEILDPFTEIKKVVNTTKDELNAEDLGEMMRHTLERFDCEPTGCEVCQQFHILFLKHKLVTF